MKPVKTATERYGKPTGELATLVYVENAGWHVVNAYAPDLPGLDGHHRHATDYAARVHWRNLRRDLAAAGYRRLSHFWGPAIDTPADGEWWSPDVWLAPTAWE